MRNRAVKLVLLLVAAAGAVVAWQRRNETPPTAPMPRPSALGTARTGSSLPAAEPFMDPAPAVAAAPLLTPDVLPDPDEAPGSGSREAVAEPVAEAAADVGSAIAEDITPVRGTPVLDSVFVEEVDERAEVAEAAASPRTAADQAPLPTPPHGPFAEAPAGPADDLKRISGVGPTLERMLNEQGITTFAQLAALDEEGVDRLQSRLPQFPGRIRRDDWIGQATRFMG